MNEKPPRLIDDPELGPALRAARDESLSPERLAANARALDATLSKLPPPGGFPVGTAALTGGAIVALLAILRLGAGPAPTPAALPSPAAVVSSVVETPSLADASPAVTSAPIATPDAAATTTNVVVRPATPAATPALAISTSVPTPTTGTLADELRLYDDARAFAKKGEPSAALARLDELALRFPRTSLAPEAAITRAEALVSAGRLGDASALLTRLVADPVHAGRRSELERTLGDVERARGNCTSARTHYRAALDAGASGEEASAVRRGLGACEAE